MHFLRQVEHRTHNRPACGAWWQARGIYLQDDNILVSPLNTIQKVITYEVTTVLLKWLQLQKPLMAQLSRAPQFEPQLS